VGAVLLDLLMPGMDGFQVIRYTRAQETLRELLIFSYDRREPHSGSGDDLNRETQALLQKDSSWQQQLMGEIGRVLTRGKRAYGAGGNEKGSGR
jgi:CheY-like chemotaxis protein